MFPCFVGMEDAHILGGDLFCNHLGSCRVFQGLTCTRLWRAHGWWSKAPVSTGGPWTGGTGGTGRRCTGRQLGDSSVSASGVGAGFCRKMDRIHGHQLEFFSGLGKPGFIGQVQSWVRLSTVCRFVPQTIRSLSGRKKRTSKLKGHRTSIPPAPIPYNSHAQQVMKAATLVSASSNHCHTKRVAAKRKSRPQVLNGHLQALKAVEKLGSVCT